jgi:beta-N-acetylhexosaminidase
MGENNSAKTPGSLMLDVEGLRLNSEERELLLRPQVGGVVLFARNYSDPRQLQTLATEIRTCNPALLIAVDQEGGRVQRFKQGFTRLPAMHSFGLLHGDDPSRALELSAVCGWLMAAELLVCGVDLSFAPVLDLYLASSRVIADRAFAAAPETAAQLAAAFIEGMHSAGMKATGKHFPGHGSVEADSHSEIPIDERSLEAITASDLYTFSHCARLLDAVMPAHVIYPRVDRHCAGFSEIWLKEILRGKLVFDGVIFSDDLSMVAALSAGTIEQRAEAAMQAGCDMLLVCNHRQDALRVADWLAAADYPASKRLASMRGKTDEDYSSLRASPRWKKAREQLAPLLLS